MTFSALRVTYFFYVLSSAVLVSAQSGTPVPMTPLANPDPRLAAFHAQTGKLAMPGGVALSPDGTMVAWTLRGKDNAALHLMELGEHGKGTEKIVAPNEEKDCSSMAPVWSPDSQTLAYTSTCTGKDQKSGQEQLFLYSRIAGTSRQLTHLDGIFHQAAFAPSGKAVAVLFVENATRSAGALAAMTPWSGVIGQDHVEVQRVYSISTDTGQGGFVSPEGLHVYEFDWSPAAPGFTYIAANPPGENNWWVAKLYYQKQDTKPVVVFDPGTTSNALKGLQMAVPRFSPDGTKIAFIGGLMSDQGSTGGDIWVVPTKGGEPTNVTPGIDGSPTYLAWTGKDKIDLVEDRRGHTLLAQYVVGTHARDAEHDLGEVSIGGGPIKDAIGIATNNTVAFIETGHGQAPEIFAGPFADPKQLTHLNPDLKPASRTESVEWKSDGFNVQGWLTYPKNYDAAKKYPLIVNVPGGPSASIGARWGSSVWSELGYFELQPNPRGSFGQGEKFTAANVKDFGYGDLRDILAGMDAVEKKVSIDAHREGLTGWSYGGFMTMFAVTQTNRFRAAVAGAGISDWKSYYGENSIDQWMVPFFGATVYDDPAVYAKSSAIEFIKKVKTPTLVIVGDRDGECPAPQSFEFWHALRAEGVKTQLVVYPNEGHGFRDPEHIRDREARTAAWFASEMPAQ